MADQYHHGNLKSKLLEEAVTLISQDGLENLSLRRLATQCGVSHNAIYRHFDSKERLIDACRAYVMQELTRTLELTLSGLDESLPQTMEQLGTAYLDFYMRNPTYFSAYFRNASQKLTFSLEPIEGNYPPFSVFRRYTAWALTERFSSMESPTSLASRRLSSAPRRARTSSCGAIRTLAETSSMSKMWHVLSVLLLRAKRRTASTT